DIFIAVAEGGFRLLGGAVGPAAETERQVEATPLERIRSIFRRLYEFSREHPQYFALMFVDRSVPRVSREYERFAFAREMKARLVEDIRACIEAGEFSISLDPSIAMRTLMVGLLGVAMLRLSDRLAPGENADLL